MKWSCVGLMTLVAASSATADIFTTKASFVAAIEAGFYEEKFNDVVGGAIAELAFGPVNGFEYTITGELGQLFNDPGVVSVDQATDKLVITFSAGKAVTAIGGNFWATDISFNVIPSNVTIELSDGTKTTYLASANSVFRGFTSTTPITKVTIDAADTPVNAWPTMDNFIVGTAAGGTACYPDCDLSGNLNIDDFICFQTNFVLGEKAADCDLSGNLNIDDFICFQTFFVLGC
jgi:hypothetical protein